LIETGNNMFAAGKSNIKHTSMLDGEFVENFQVRRQAKTDTACATTRRTAGSIFPGCGATKRWCSRYMTRGKTAARVSPRTLHSTIRTRRPVRRRARA